MHLEETKWRESTVGFCVERSGFHGSRSGAVPTEAPGGHHVQGLFRKLNEHGLQVSEKTNFNKLFTEDFNTIYFRHCRLKEQENDKQNVTVTSQCLLLVTPMGIRNPTKYVLL